LDKEELEVATVQMETFHVATVVVIQFLQALQQLAEVAVELVKV
jgi:hypothetical protein